MNTLIVLTDMNTTIFIIGLGLQNVPACDVHYYLYIFCLFFSQDPTRLLITLGADVNKKDLVHGNTPLHWGLLVGNHTALMQTCKQNVDLNALNLNVSEFQKNRVVLCVLSQNFLGFYIPCSIRLCSLV